VVGTGEVRFLLSESGRIVLRAFDVTGACLGTIADGRYSSGVHRTNWRPPGSGVYFLRLDTPAGRLAARRVTPR